jgi:signal transduction histidine kinase
MEQTRQIAETLLRSRRAMVVALSLILVVLGAVVLAATLKTGQSIRRQIAGRDGEVLYAMALMLYAQDVADGLAGPISDPGSQLSIVLRSSELRGVLGVRLFNTNGTFVESFPPYVTEQNLDQAHLGRLQQLRPSSRFHAALAVEDLFYPDRSDNEGGAMPVLEVNVPLHTPGGPLAGIAQFLLEGQSIAAEYAQLNRHLAMQASVGFGASALIVGSTVLWAFGRVRRFHRLIAERNEDLLRANRELALAAKTSALGAVAAHLIHGLKNPLAGLQQFVSSRGQDSNFNGESDWQQAVASTRRMQTLINQVVGVLREEHSGTAYEVTLEELRQTLLRRLQPLALERKVDLTAAVEGAARLPNRVANLVILILVNLTENAIQATPPGKQVALWLKGGPVEWTFEVRDQGPGFPVEVPMFMPCHSTKEGGTGIGLALSKQLANHLGADLVLSSSSAEGCVFTLRLAARVAGIEALAAATG